MSILPFMNQKPSEIHPGLKEEYLVKVASLINRVRFEALQTHETKKGDSHWGLNTKFHERTIFALFNISKDWSSWLGVVVKKGQHFVFSIGGVPVRFYRGFSDKPKRNYLKRCEEEIQYSFKYLPEADRDWFWRICIETEPNGEIFRIVIFQANEYGDTRNHWEIPFISFNPDPNGSIKKPADPIILDSPKIAIKK